MRPCQRPHADAHRLMGNGLQGMKQTKCSFAWASVVGGEGALLRCLKRVKLYRQKTQCEVLKFCSALPGRERSFNWRAPNQTLQEENLGVQLCRLDQSE